MARAQRSVVKLVTPKYPYSQWRDIDTSGVQRLMVMSMSKTEQMNHALKMLIYEIISTVIICTLFPSLSSHHHEANL